MKQSIVRQVMFEISVHNARLDIPKDPAVCPPALAALMTSCWQTDPSLRPSALEVQASLEGLLREIDCIPPPPSPLSAAVLVDCSIPPSST